ncbi:MAG: DnaJ domain-containing protein [Nitrospirota bacterium]|nr:MAG: DnaJ domain-containing protein [Nitrospirota bacterium]
MSTGDINGSAGASDDNIRKIERLYSDLETLDYYSLLEIDKGSSESDIKKRFRDVAMEFHPDRHSSLPDDVKDKLTEIYTHMTNAYNVLKDPRTRQEYDASPSSVRTGAVSEDALAEEKFNEGMVEFRNKNYSESTQLFGSATYLVENEKKYHFYHGMSLLREDRAKDAERSFRKAYEIDPSDDKVLAELGHIYLNMGFNLRAKKNFESAVKIDPENSRAKEGIALLSDFEEK